MTSGGTPGPQLQWYGNGRMHDVFILCGLRFTRGINFLAGAALSLAWTHANGAVILYCGKFGCLMEQKQQLVFCMCYCFRRTADVSRVYVAVSCRFALPMCADRLVLTAFSVFEHRLFEWHRFWWRSLFPGVSGVQFAFPKRNTGSWEAEQLL